MRFSGRPLVVLVVALATLYIAAPSASAKPAHCDNKTGFCSPAEKLKFFGPTTLTVDVPATLTSKDPCPLQRPDGSPLHAATQVLVTLSFEPGGSAENWIFAEPDGSWSLTFSVGPGNTSVVFIVACIDRPFRDDEVTTAEYRNLSATVFSGS
jgi:hypothetical protein